MNPQPKKMTLPNNPQYISNNISRVINGLSPERWTSLEAKKLLHASKQDSLPIDVNAIFPYRRIEPSITFDRNLKYSARLITTNHGFQIIVNERLNESSMQGVLRFTIAHEIGHTYFYDLEETPPSRYPWLSSLDKSEEMICDLFASALLIPDNMITSRYQKENLFLHNLQKLSGDFQVSYSAMAMKIIFHLSIWDGILLACRWLPKSNYDASDNQDAEEDKAWRVRWSVIPNNLSSELYIPKPTTYRNFLPSLKWGMIDSLIRESESYAIKKFNITDIEAGRLGNLRQVLQKYLGVHLNYTIYGVVLEPSNSSGQLKEKTVLLAIGLNPNLPELATDQSNRETKTSNNGIKTDRLVRRGFQLSLPFEE
ncbi:MAG: ImmA/IrrE family metallo-endopeptidase [Desulfobacterales bacterium]|nr:ImmA/IrrE family metallo-endopeptidase [Desulfobacterales bacterium]